MSKQMGRSGALTFGIILAISSILGNARPASAITLPLVSRNILKSFFQAGDKPTAAQFATLIDSTVNIVDDRKLIGLKVYNPALIYSVGDTAIFNRLAPGDTIGAIDGGSSGQLEFGGLTGLSPNDPLSVDVAHDFAGAYGFMGIKLQAPNGDINYGYIQLGMAPSGSPPAIQVDYIVYNDVANQPLEVVPVPEPTSALALGTIALLMLRRRRAIC